MTTTINLFRNEKDALSFAAGQTIFSKGDHGDLMKVMAERLRKRMAALAADL